jgi:type II secretion system protein C
MYEENSSITGILKSGPMIAFTKVLGKQKARVVEVASVLFIAYVCATIASSIIVSTLMDKAVLKDRKPAAAAAAAAASTNANPLNTERKVNYVLLRKSIMSRNLFNSTGEVPDESEGVTDTQNGSKKVFDPTAKCEKSKLSLTLLGTIFMGSEENSLATVKEAGFDDADIYKAGDFIVGNDGAQIVAVTRKKVVINNNGIKECLSIDEKEDSRASPSFDPQATESATTGATKDGAAATESEGGCVSLEGGYVETELGDGFGKIITAARLVPNMEENKVSGFKIFAINTSSLFGKVGFKNGDIITQVNDVSLKLPEQGFALYEAFQDEREISIHVLRGGQTPKTLCVKIK